MLKYALVPLMVVLLAGSAFAEVVPRPAGRTVTTLPSCVGNWQCAPTTPANLQVDAVSCTELLATWDASEPNNGSDVKGYTLYENLPTFQSTNVPFPATEVLLDADPVTEYVFEIAAYDSLNNTSAHTTWAFVTTPPCDGTTTTTLPSCVGNWQCAPTTPENVQAQAVSCSEVLVTWGASEPNNGSDVRNYTVFQLREGEEYTNDFDTLWVNHPETEAVFAALPGVEYYYYVGAGDSNNNYSSYSGDWPYVTTPFCDGEGEPVILHHIYCGDPVRLDNAPDGAKIPLTGCEAHVRRTLDYDNE